MAPDCSVKCRQLRFSWSCNGYPKTLLSKAGFVLHPYKNSPKVPRSLEPKPFMVVKKFSICSLISECIRQPQGLKDFCVSEINGKALYSSVFLIVSEETLVFRQRGLSAWVETRAAFLFRLCCFVMEDSIQSNEKWKFVERAIQRATSLARCLYVSHQLRRKSGEDERLFSNYWALTVNPLFYSSPVQKSD